MRDLMRRRLGLVQAASRQLISVQSTLWRHTGSMVSTNQIRKPRFVAPLTEAHVVLAIQGALSVYPAVREQIEAVEQTVLAHAELRSEFEALRTMTGAGRVFHAARSGAL